ncbi:MAG: phosphate acyltransferase PlsX [Clostridia bacterium]|nr:phosphate acyltransferase PlsX [Clostridia bacterium]
MKLVIDCMGGDNSPGANVAGGVLALEKYPDLTLVFSGDEAAIKAEIEKTGFTDRSRYEILHAPEVITGEDKPTDAIRLKRESSMMKGIKLLRESEDIDGIVSTGATGSLVAAATLRIGRLEGVFRPAFCPILPTMNGGIVGVCDSGANVDCLPLQLVQFAVMASAYMEHTFGIENPRIALLNIGTESEKGDELRKEVYKRLSALPGINFVGNMESRDLLSGKYDVVVCDGFSGNVLIKTTEGTALQLMKKIKKDIYSRTVYKLGALFMKKMFSDMKEFMNYQRYGGSVLLGTEKIIVKGHGASDKVAVAKCIEQARSMKGSGLNGIIAEKIAAIPEDEAEPES